MTKKILIVSVVTVLMLVLFAACAGPGGGAPAAGAGGGAVAADAPAGQPGEAGGTVRMLMTPSDQWTETYALLRTEFAELFPDIDLEVDLMGSTEIHVRYLTEFASGRSDYDIINSRHIYKNQLVLSGHVVNITDFLDNSDVISRDSFLPSFANPMVVVDGRWYGLPWRSDVKLFFYNKDLFERAGITSPPTTYLEVIEVAERIQAETGQFGIVIPASGRWILQAFTDYISTIGDVTYFDSNWEPIFNNPERVEGVNTLRRLLELSPPGALAYDHAGAVTAFIQGQAGMLFMWPFVYSEAQNPGQSAIVGQVGIADAMPFVNHETAVLSGWNTMMTSFSENRDAAWMVMEFMSSPSTERQVILNGGNNNPVLAVSAYDEELVTAVPVVRSILQAQAAERAFMDYDIADWAEIGLIIQDFLARAVSGEMDSQAAMDEAARQAREILVDAGLVN